MSSNKNTNCFKLNSKRVCLFCLKVGKGFTGEDGDDDDDSFDSVQGFKMCRLGNLAQFLKPDAWKRIEEWICSKIIVRYNPYRTYKDLEVPLCEDCNALVLQFGDSFKELTSSEQELTRCCKLFSPGLESSYSNDNDRDIVEVVGGSEEMGHEKVAELNTTEISTLMNQLRSDFLQKAQKEFNANKKKLLQQDKEDVQLSPVTELLQVTGKPNCEFCRGKFSEKSEVSRHMINHHREMFFSLELKHPWVSPLQFKVIVYHLLFKHLEQFRVKISCGKFKCSCPYCERVFFESRNYGFRPHILSHLIEKHRKDLRQRLDTIQRAPDLDSQLHECSALGQECPCGKYVAWRNYMYKHKKEFCSGVSKNGDIKLCDKCYSWKDRTGFEIHRKQCSGTSLENPKKRIRPSRSKAKTTASTNATESLEEHTKLNCTHAKKLKQEVEVETDEA